VYRPLPRGKEGYACPGRCKTPTAQQYLGASDDLRSPSFPVLFDGYPHCAFPSEQTWRQLAHAYGILEIRYQNTVLGKTPSSSW
jgi:hypothetical protein